jgi:hypothetical protein
MAALSLALLARPAAGDFYAELCLVYEFDWFTSMKQSTSARSLVSW